MTSTIQGVSKKHGTYTARTCKCNSNNLDQASTKWQVSHESRNWFKYTTQRDRAERWSSQESHDLLQVCLFSSRTCLLRDVTVVCDAWNSPQQCSTAVVELLESWEEAFTSVGNQLLVFVVQLQCGARIFNRVVTGCLNCFLCNRFWTTVLKLDAEVFTLKPIFISKYTTRRLTNHNNS